MNLSNLPKIKGNKSKAKRLGRGAGSGKGFHTVGRGMKGQKSRTGKGIPFGFEGGQVPLYKKLPKIGGFKNPTRKQIKGIKTNYFTRFKAGDEVSPKSLVENGVLKRIPKHGVKIILGNKVPNKLKLSGFLYSQTAKQALLDNGNEVLN